MSRNLLRRVLREKYKFNGVIATDATIMEAISQLLEIL